MSIFWPDYTANPWFEMGRSLASFERFRREMDRLFDDYGQSVGNTASVGDPNVAAADLIDTGQSYVMRADVPGMTDGELEVSVLGNSLTVRGERKDDVPEGYAVHRKERGGLKFARSWRLPASVEADKADARLENGVLVLTVPKAKEAQPKQITVKAS